MEKFNIYCDESCHLPNDNSNFMVIGGIKCPKSKAYLLNHEIKALKVKHGLFEYSELKWNKVTEKKLDLYKDVVDLFFKYDFLTFRAVLAENKKSLSLDKYNISYDDWYYRIYYLALKEMIDINNTYNIYIDIKDTNGTMKICKLQDVLNHTLYDFSSSTVSKIQEVRSDQVNILQLSDILIGAISHNARGLSSSKAKTELISYISEKAQRPLIYSSPKSEIKFNIFRWSPRGVHNVWML